MKTSKKGVDLIKKFEGLHDGDLKIIGLQPKMDPIGIWTEGYGRAMRDSKGNFIKGIENKKLAYSRITITTEPKAVIALSNDLRVYEAIVERKIKVPISQDLFDACVSHTYNTGGSNTIFEMINNHSDIMLLKGWWVSHYIMGGGIQLPGLIERRKAEARLITML